MKNTDVKKLELNELREKRLLALRKRKQQQLFHILLACIMTSIIVLVIVHFSNHANASDFDNPRTKYYTGIHIQQGDSLWSIAEEYMSEEYDSIQDYIKELKNINQLKGDTIYSGNYLIVSYYK